MIVADTDVVSYIERRAPQAWSFVETMAGHELLISFVTVAEIEHGMARARWGQSRRHRMRGYLGTYQVLESSPPLCRLWGEVLAESEEQGRRLDSEDAWVAATALWTGAQLATNNRRHFEHLSGLRLL